MTPTPERTKNGKIVWRISYTVAKRRVRRTFRTREEAREWIDENSDIATTEGQIFWQAWRGITPAERHELMDSLALMRKHRATHPKSTILAAVQSFIALEEAIEASLSLREAVDRYLASKLNNKRKGSVSDGWYKVLKPCLNRVVRELDVYRALKNDVIRPVHCSKFPDPVVNGASGPEGLNAPFAIFPV